jgi:hypothetical protein
MPGSQVGTCSTTKTGLDMGTTEGTVSFTGMSASVTSGLYFIVAKTSANDASNYFKWAYNGSATSGMYASAYPSTLSGYGSPDGRQLKFTVYK